MRRNPLLMLPAVATVFSVLAITPDVAFGQGSSSIRPPSVVRDQLQNTSPGFFLRGHRQAIARARDDSAPTVPLPRLSREDAKRTAVYQIAVVRRLRERQYDEVPIALLTGHDLVRRGLLTPSELGPWMRTVGDALAEERRRNWRTRPGRVPNEVSVALEAVSKVARDPRTRHAAEIGGIAVKSGLLDRLFPGGCGDRAFACSFYEQAQASQYTSRAVEAMVAAMQRDPGFAQTVDNYLNANDITNFRFETSPSDILRDNVDLSTDDKLDRLLERFEALEQRLPPRPDGTVASLEDRIAEVVRLEFGQLRDALERSVPQASEVVDRRVAYEQTLAQIQTYEQGFTLLTTLVGIVDPRAAQRLDSFAGSLVNVAKARAAFELSDTLGNVFALSNAYVGVAVVIAGLLTPDNGPNVDQMILDALGTISRQIAAFQDEVRFRFSRIEQILSSSFSELRDRLDDISRQVAAIGADVRLLQARLVAISEQIERTERVLLNTVLDVGELDFSTQEIPCLSRRDAGPMLFDGPTGYTGCADAFRSWATDYAQVRGNALAAQGEPADLTTLALRGSALGNSALGALSVTPLPSMQPYLRGAEAYLALANAFPHFALGYDGRKREIRDTASDIRDMQQEGERLVRVLESIFFGSVRAPTGASPAESDSRVVVVHREFVHALHDEQQRLVAAAVAAVEEGIEDRLRVSYLGFNPFDPSAPSLQSRGPLLGDDLAGQLLPLPECQNTDLPFSVLPELPRSWINEIPFGINLARRLSNASISACYRVTVDGLDHPFIGNPIAHGGRVFVAEQNPIRDGWDRIRAGVSGSTHLGLSFNFEVVVEANFTPPGPLNPFNLPPPAPYRMVIPFGHQIEWACTPIVSGAALPLESRGPSGFPYPPERIFCRGWGWGDFVWSIRRIADERLRPLFQEEWHKTLLQLPSRPPLVIRSVDGLTAEYPRFSYTSDTMTRINSTYEETLGDRVVSQALDDLLNPAGARHDKWRELQRHIAFYNAFISAGLAVDVAAAVAGRREELPLGNAYLALMRDDHALTAERFSEIMRSDADRLRRSVMRRSQQDQQWTPSVVRPINLVSQQGAKKLIADVRERQQELLQRLKGILAVATPRDAIDPRLQEVLEQMRALILRSEIALVSPSNLERPQSSSP
jgi:hypothetical protein